MSEYPIPEDLTEWHLDTQIRKRAWEPCVVRLLIERIAKQDAEIERLKEEIGGFPNLAALRQAMIDTADENASLKAQVARLSAPVSDKEFKRMEWWPMDKVVREYFDAIIAARAAKEKP